jgi:hypothetical protein
VTLENLIGKGLQREPASAEEIHRFLARIATRLADAQKDTISLDSRFDLANDKKSGYRLLSRLLDPNIGSARMRRNPWRAAMSSVCTIMIDGP